MTMVVLHLLADRMVMSLHRIVLREFTSQYMLCSVLVVLMIVTTSCCVFSATKRNNYISLFSLFISVLDLQLPITTRPC